MNFSILNKSSLSYLRELNIYTECGKLQLSKLGIVFVPLGLLMDCDLKIYCVPPSLPISLPVETQSSSP